MCRAGPKHGTQLLKSTLLLGSDEGVNAGDQFESGRRQVGRGQGKKLCNNIILCKGL